MAGAAAEIPDHVTLPDLIEKSAEAATEVTKLKKKYSATLEGDGPIAEAANTVLNLLEHLIESYSGKSKTLSENIKSITDAAAEALAEQQGSASLEDIKNAMQKAVDLATKLEGKAPESAQVAAAKLKISEIESAASGAAAGKTPPQQQNRADVAASSNVMRQVNKINANTDGPGDPGMRGAFPNQGGGFRYSAKKRRRTPSHKKTKVKRTSSKRKLASLRGGRKRTSHRTSRKTSRKTSRRTSRKTSHKKRRTSHRRRKH